MFLKKIVLRKVRCFADVSIDFDLSGGNNRKWTVLIGENGTGKSTVLKAVALALAGSDALAELVPDPDAWIASGSDDAELLAEIETAEGEPRTVKLEFRRGEGVSRFIARSQETLKPLNDALEQSTRAYPAFGYGPSRRLADRTLASRGHSLYTHPRARSVASLFSRQADLNPLENWAMQLDYRTGGEGLEVVRQVLADFLPEIAFSHIDKEGERLMFKTPDGQVPLAELSDGYQNVAAWVGDLLFQITSTFEDYRDPFNARGLLIIDEVDLHLHPIWQRRLLSFLESRLPRMQLLVTTHSIVTAQQSPANSLFYCVRREERPVIEHFDHDPGKFLLHQLAATEAFGHLSDESYDLEHLKSEYRALSRKSDKNPGDRSRMERISQEIGQAPVDPRDAAVLTPDQVEMMKQILEVQRGGPA